jgi:acetylornithine deacetylase/succinyl-diaminopimelate desuccinylase-like protein
MSKDAIRVLLGVCAVAVSSAAFALELKPHELRAKEIFKELIEIDTTHSTGDTTLASQAMADRLIAAGLPKEDIHLLAEVPRKGNLVARLRAKNPTKKPILLMAHLDVVEAKREDWSTDPFKFVEQDGYYYARGIVDDKAMASIFVANLVRYLEEGYKPKRDVILALTADEESGPDNGMKWLVDNHRHLIDAAFAINEGGGGQMRGGKKLLNGVQAAEKVYLGFEIEATDRGGHSSQPRKENPIYRVSEALTRVGRHEFPIELNEVTRGYFSAMAKLETGQMAEDIRSILSASPDPQAAARIGDQPAYNSMLRTTCVATEVKAGHAPNALPQSAKATINCRMLPGRDPKQVERTLREVIADDRIAMKQLREPRISPPSPLTREVFGPIEKLTQKMWPGVPVVPLMSTGATDAVFPRSAGIPVYGVSGIFGDIDDVRIHGRDERIAIQSYYDSLEFLYQLVKELTR